MQYSQDHEGSLPPLDNVMLLRNKLDAYLKFQDKVIDPATGEPFGVQTGDTFVSPLSGKPYQFVSRLTRIASSPPPAATMLFRDAPTPLPNKSTVVLEAFADGHVEGRFAQ